MEFDITTFDLMTINLTNWVILIPHQDKFSIAIFSNLLFNVNENLEI